MKEYAATSDFVFVIRVRKVDFPYNKNHGIYMSLNILPMAGGDRTRGDVRQMESRRERFERRRIY